MFAVFLEKQYKLIKFTIKNNTLKILFTIFLLFSLGSVAQTAKIESTVGTAEAIDNAVYGLQKNTNPSTFTTGLKGSNKATNGLGTGVFGSHDGSGSGVNGYSVSGNGISGTSAGGVGVSGESVNGNGAYFSSSLKYALITGTGKVGIGLNNPTNLLDVNGRVRIRHANSETSGIWFNNSSNSLSSVAGAFYGMKLDTETGVYIGNAWRFWVNSSGDITSTGLAGTGFRSVYADPNGKLTASIQQKYYSISPSELTYVGNGSFRTDFNSAAYASGSTITDYLIAPIHLPDGANIVSIVVHYIDQTANADLSGSFIVRSNATGSTIVGGSFLSTGASASIQSYVVIPSASYNIIDNDTNATYLSFYTPRIAGIGWDSNVVISGIKIVYTI
jgi:hypothetical protein